MTLIFRIFFELIKSKYTNRTRINDEHISRFWVVPTDLDFNGHMTNNRYHTIMDYSALGLMGSHGLLAVMFKKKWRPIVGCSLVSHRKSLKIFDRYTVKSKIIYCDAMWSYLSHIIECDGQIIAAANRKYALLSRNGLVKSKTIFSEIGEDFNNKPSDIDSIKSWIDAEKTVLGHSRTAKTENQVDEMEISMSCKKDIAVSILGNKSGELDAVPCLYAGLACAKKVGCLVQNKEPINS